MNPLQKALQEGIDNPRGHRLPSIPLGDHTLKLVDYDYKDGSGNSGLFGSIFSWEVIESTTQRVGARFSSVHFLNGVSPKGAQATTGMRRAAAAELVEVLRALLRAPEEEISAVDMAEALENVDAFGRAFFGQSVACTGYERTSKDGEQTYVNQRWSVAA